MMMIDIYFVLTELSKKLDENSDKHRDIEFFIKEIFNKLDPSIRYHLRKGGLSILMNTYTGFDSEYQNLDSQHNKLLSVQLAVGSRLILKMPLRGKEYILSKLDPLKGTLYIQKTFLDSVDYSKITTYLTERINKLRELNFKSFDESIETLDKGLRELGIPFICTDRQVIFKFNNSTIKTWFYSKIKEEGISLEDLVKKSNDMSNP